MSENKKRIKKVLEIRRSNASGPIQSKKKYNRKKVKTTLNKDIIEEK
jgi:hypothetical protein